MKNINEILKRLKIYLSLLESDFSLFFFIV